MCRFEEPEEYETPEERDTRCFDLWRLRKWVEAGRKKARKEEARKEVAK